MKYILTFYFKEKFQNFCITEFLSICEMYKIKNLTFNEGTYSYNPQTEPYITLLFDGIENKELCDEIISRSVMIKNIIKVYGEGENIDDTINNVNTIDLLDEIESTSTFRFDVDIRGSSLKQQEKVEWINKFAKFNFKGSVNLKQSERLFIIFKNTHNNYMFFGRQISGKNDKDTRFYSKYDLINRKYLGPTSTDHILAFWMSNLGQVNKNEMVIDPFAGTGSLLIPPTHYGAFVFGCDVDIRVLKGYAVGYVRQEKKTVKNQANIFSNFDDYGLTRPQIIRQDINHPSLKKLNHKFDAIVCDPPYGYRACSKKTGWEDDKKEKREKRINEKQERIKKTKEDKDKNKNENENENENDNENNTNDKAEEKLSEEEDEIDDFEEDWQLNDPKYCHFNGDKKWYTPWKHCEINKIFESLINFANDALKENGILVCLYPTKRTADQKDLYFLPINFPRHDSFNLIHACENKYSELKSRWCLVYRKTN